MGVLVRLVHRAQVLVGAEVAQDRAARLSLLHGGLDHLDGAGRVAGLAHDAPPKLRVDAVVPGEELGHLFPHLRRILVELGELVHAVVHAEAAAEVDVRDLRLAAGQVADLLGEVHESPRRIHDLRDGHALGADVHVQAADPRVRVEHRDALLEVPGVHLQAKLGAGVVRGRDGDGALALARVHPHTHHLALHHRRLIQAASDEQTAHFIRLLTAVHVHQAARGDRAHQLAPGLRRRVEAHLMRLKAQRQRVLHLRDARALGAQAEAEQLLQDAAERTGLHGEEVEDGRRQVLRAVAYDLAEAVEVEDVYTWLTYGVNTVLRVKTLRRIDSRAPSATPPRAPRQPCGLRARRDPSLPASVRREAWLRSSCLVWFRGVTKLTDTRRSAAEIFSNQHYQN
eukprot:scaffold1596_cov302-Pinguiococcus_pyrenoidosus.AAC.77